MADPSSGSCESASPVIEGYKDNYNGIVVKPKHYGQISAEAFEQLLADSLASWKSSGKRGVWLSIPIGQAELIPVAAKLGFEFHHSKPAEVTMARWLPEDEPSTLPIYASHNIGVGGLVVNDKNEILVVQEKWLRSIKLAHWKLPGGVCDPGEDIWKTAIRETFEETGIKTEFVSVLLFRQMHNYTWGIDDLYYTCLLRPLNTDIQEDSSEIAAAKWIDMDEYAADPNTFPGNVYVIHAYKEGVKSGRMIQPAIYPHFVAGKPDLSIYQIRSCDPSQPCDLNRREWTWALKNQWVLKDPVSLQSQDLPPKSNI